MTRDIFRLFLVIVIFVTNLAAQENRAPGPNCECPEFSIESNFATVKAGDLVTFSIPRIAYRGQTAPVGKFEWTLSQGAIVSGQGTSKIFVQTTRQMLAVPSPTPLPDPGDAGFVVSIGRHPTLPTIVARAKFIPAGECSCSEVSATVEIGERSVEPNKPANMTGLKLSSQKLISPCSPGTMPANKDEVSKEMVIDVAASATDPEDDVLTFEYVVSAGRIVGTGANVKWDLTGAAPGKHTITAAVDDGCGLCGRSWTEQVTVEACEPACGLIVCPTIEIRSAETLESESVFTADVSGGTATDITYTWSITDGEIVSGQGTPQVRAKIAPSGTITVAIGGIDPRGSCPVSATKRFRNK